MKLTLLSALLPVASLALPSWPHGGPGGHKGHGFGGKKAAYFLRVDPAGSNIVAIEIGSDGKLTDSTSVTSTDGAGLQSQNFTSPTLAPTAFDPLQGQDAVTIGDDYLFTVNSGSDTVVMFKVDPENPLSLEIVGKPAPSLGQFAMAVSYSSKYKKLCVLNGGAVNGVACYSVSSKGLVPDGVGLRSFGFNATTPAQLGGPSGSGSDIHFSLDSSKLITSFKGSATTTGHITVFDVDSSGNVAKTFKDNSFEPLSALFGFALSPADATSMFFSDAAYGGVLVTLDDSTDTVSVDAVVNSTHFKAACWTFYYGGDFYDVDAASPKFGKVSAAGDLESFVHYDKALKGGFDSGLLGSTVYFLTETNTIAVLDLSSGDLVQKYSYSTAEDRPHWTGFAIWPSFSGFYGGGW